ncbi:1-aminocyclopropane-1-carboxylate synthase [Acrasis kona]|uniref:1-aminocyclopropane-1-carboxylate synthase n=1 Tax=Acrasis kona TaxID=1008807 RepID=A0AAW2YUT3_9EUKA
MTEYIQTINKDHPVQTTDLNYTDFAGAPQFRTQLAKFFQKRLFALSNEVATVDPNNFMVFNGAGSIIESLSSSVCESGNYIMIPAPQYLAFENDLNRRFGCNMLPLYMPYNKEANEFQLNKRDIQACLDQAKSEGKKVRGFLLCNPNNPTGDIYPRELVEWIIDWCSENSIHFISDEVYGLSIFNKRNGEEFVSAGRIAHEGIASGNASHDYTHVHIVYSFSKDITLNGFRVGVLYTLNQDVLNFMRGNSYFQGVSSHTQKLLTHLLERDDLLGNFLLENNKNLTHSYNQVASALDEFKIKYVVPSAGVLMWVDLSGLIKKKLNKDTIDQQDEITFWQGCFDEARVYIPAGQFFKCNVPGWFRVCFTTYSADITTLAFQRILNWVEKNERIIVN